MNTLISFTLSILTLSLYSQGYGDAWIVGYENDSTSVPKFGKTILDFSNGVLNLNYTFGEREPDIGTTNTSLAYFNGRLRYFTDGYHIYGGDQKILPGGDSINFGRIWIDYRAGGYPPGYNHFFLPMPDKESNETLLLHFNTEYHTEFTKRYVYYPNFKVSKIKFNSSTGKDSVVYKDSIILKGDFIETHIACVKHANGRDWWIIIEDYLSNNHRLFLLDPSGIHFHHNQEIGFPADSFSWTGNSLFTPDGTQYIKFLRGYQIQIFDFDRCQGSLSNPRSIINEKTYTKDLCYLEVSPNSRFLYLNSDTTIWQYDLYANDIKSSETVIGVWDGYYFKNVLSTDFFQMSLAPDGKIYLSCRSSTNLAHVIHKPNEKGTKCEFQLRGLELPAYMFGSFPKMPNFRLGALLGSVCDSLTSVNNRFYSIDENVIVYPNATSSNIVIKDISGKFNSKISIKIMNISGQMFYSREYLNLSNEINIPVIDYPRGMYILELEDVVGNHGVKKFIKL